MTEMDEADRSAWDRLNETTGGADALAKFERHMPALISAHPKSAPATLEAMPPSLHKSKKEIDGEWPKEESAVAVAAAAPPSPERQEHQLLPHHHPMKEKRVSRGPSFVEVGLIFPFKGCCVWN